MKWVTCSLEETVKFGELLARFLVARDVVALVGDVGAGKTALVTGIVKGLGVFQHEISSPTFTIVNEYQGRLRILHADVYRISDIEELEHIGFEEYFDLEAVFLIEWADLIKKILPASRLEIIVKSGIDENSREFEIKENFRGYTQLRDFMKNMGNPSGQGADYENSGCGYFL